MERVTRFCLAATVLAAAFLLAGCPGTDGAESTFVPQEGEFTVAVKVGEGAKYYSLSVEGGVEVTDQAAIKSTGWDIGFERTRMIYTNSGITATKLGSGGKGMVWHTEKLGSAFDTATMDDRVDNDFNKLWEIDKEVTLAGRGNNEQKSLNVMCFPGYNTGTGAADSPYSGMAFSKAKSIWGPEDAATSMDYSLISQRVFIVRHGDGNHHSKVQITTYTSTGGSADGVDTYIVKFENIN